MKECEVRTKYGAVRGKAEDGVVKWLGIPYAEKPLGKLRFRKAQPPKPWKGVKETVKFGDRPIQPTFFIQSKDMTESEDCLYLNVLSSGTEKKKPVVIWIYGGAFMMGEASTAMYDGTQFAKNDIVFVSFNYRVGIFGGYDLSNLPYNHGEFDDNIFISDQVQAIKWVHENIEAFGGDPENVTIMGESAGGSSVINLMAVPAVKGMFQKVICESGVIGATVSPDTANISMRWMLRHMKISEKHMDKIKKLDDRELADASLWLLYNFTRTYPGLYLSGPAIGKLLPEYPVQAIEKGCAKGVKLLIGTNQDETTILLTEDNTSMMCHTKEEADRFLDNCEVSEELREKLDKYYSGYGSEEGIRGFMGDINFTYHSSLVADYQSQFADTYMYRFTYATEAAKQVKLGCYHSSEIPFAFDTTEKYDMKEMYEGTPQETLDYFTGIFHPAWVNFIKYGNPNGEGVSQPWPKYDTKTKQVYQIDEECKVLIDPYREMKGLISQIKIYE